MEQSNGKKFLKIIIILLLLLLIVAGGAYVFLVTDLFKTPEQAFKKYLINSVEEVSKFNSEPYGEAMKKANNEPVEITSKTKVVKESSSYWSENEKDTIISTVTLKTDIPNRNEALNVNVKNNDEDYLSLDFLITDNTYGVHLAEIHDKYLAVENRDLKKIAKTLGVEENIIDMIPDSIPETLLTAEEQEKVKQLSIKYINRILEQIDEKSYAKEKFSLDEFDGQSVKGDKYILTISESKLANIFATTVKEIFDDKEVLALLENKVPAQILEKIKESVADIGLADETETDDSNIIIAFYVSKGKCIRTELISSDNEILQFNISNRESSSTISIISKTPKTEYNPVAKELNCTISNKFENNVGEFKIEMLGTFNKDDVAAVKKENEDSLWYSESEYDEKYKDVNMTYTITSNVEGNNINSKVSYTGDNLDEELKSQEYSFNIRFGSDINIPKLTDKNSIVINDYKLEDFQKLGEEILQNITTSATENPNSIVGTYGTMMNTYNNNSNTLNNDDYTTNDDMNLSNENTHPSVLGDDNINVDNSEDIEYYRSYVDRNIKTAIEGTLQNYHDDLENDPNVNPEDYLALDKITSSVGMLIDEVELIDGTTLKCIVENYTFFVKINIDGGEWKLLGTETLYSEDGTLENAN